MSINLTERLKRARELKRTEHTSGESAKLGNLRAGSSGILTEQGDVAGSCLRKSHLRSLGIELEQPTEDKYIMFELGYANEDEMYRQLQTVLGQGEVILREEEIPIEWTTSNGTKVTGRPDIVICARGLKVVPADDHPHTEKVRDGFEIVPILGLELKSVHSIWTVRDVLFNAKPKLSNLIQAAHYMWKLNIPYKLVYKSYSQLGQGTAGADSWVSRQFPKQGERGSEYVEYNPKGQMKHIKQFEIVYDLKLDEYGRVHYKLEVEDKWTPSIVTTADIERYFEKTSRMVETGELGPRPTAVDTLGNKANYKDCSYCPLNDVCDKADKEKLKYPQWLKLVVDNTKDLKK